MDEVFKALADASRRSLLDRLHAQNGQTLHELCKSSRMFVTAMKEQQRALNPRRWNPRAIEKLRPIGRGEKRFLWRNRARRCGEKHG